MPWSKVIGYGKSLGVDVFIVEFNKYFLKCFYLVENKYFSDSHYGIMNSVLNVRFDIC